MASGDKVYVADKATLDEVNGKIGSTTDTGGSSSVGTVMAKENAVLEKIGATDDAQSSSTTTGSIFAKINYLVSKMASVYSWCSSVYSWLNNIYPKFGATTDTGGTTSAGTIMAKENAILTEVNKIGATSDTGGTATTGTVSAKVNALFNEVKQANDRLVTDNDIIKACTNYTQFILRNLPVVETEILNISGEGFIMSIAAHASAVGYTTTMKVYIDGELLFDFGIYGTGSKLVQFGITSAVVFEDLHLFKNGNLTSTTRNIASLLHFKENLRVVTTASASGENDFASITYGLKE